jgi:hypothetical protein
MDRAKLLDLSQCVVRGPRLGQHLGPFFDALSSWEKRRPLLVAWQRSPLRTYVRHGASAAVNPIFLVRVPDIKFDMYSLEIAKHFAV